LKTTEKLEAQGLTLGTKWSNRLIFYKSTKKQRSMHEKSVVKYQAIKDSHP
jgi:hypothetical protein